MEEEQDPLLASIQELEEEIERELSAIIGEPTSSSDSDSDTMVEPNPPTDPPPTMQEWEDDADADGIEAPICGGLYKDTSGSTELIIPWSGTDPDATVMCYTWSISESKWMIPISQLNTSYTRMKGPVHPGQYRPKGVKEERKTKEACTTFSGIRFSGVPKEGKGSIPIRTYKDQCRSHMIRHGMWDVFNFSDPKNPSMHCDLFKKHSRFSLAYVKAEVAKMQTDKGRVDSYIIQNLRYSGDYLRASLNAEQLTKVLQEVPITATGPEVFVATMLVCLSDSYDAMEQTKEALKAIKLTDFPGENVQQCCTKILELCERLDSAGAFEANLLCKIVRIFEQTSDKRFELWAMSKYKECADFVKGLQVSGQDMTDSSSWTITYEQLTQEAVKEYRDLVDASRWSPGVPDKKNGEPSLPQAYAAAIRKSVSDALQHVKFQSTSHSKSGSSTPGTESTSTAGGTFFDGICHYCQKKGHKAKDCRKKKADMGKTRHPNASNGDKTSGNNGNGGSGKKWWKVPPTGDPATATKKKGNRLYKWCSKCQSWRFHHAKDHDAWLARQNSDSSGSKSSSSGNVAATVTFNDDDDFIPVGGLCRVIQE